MIVLVLCAAIFYSVSSIVFGRADNRLDTKKKPSVGQEHEYCVTTCLWLQPNPNRLYSDPCCLYEDLRPPHPHLFAVVCDRGEDGAEGFEPHGDVQQMSSKEEVVVVAQDGHGGVPHQIQE